jgi:ribosome biogenesis protein ERB1
VNGSFHCKGDYIAVAVPKDSAPRRSVVVHILSKRKSINPFRKCKDAVRAVRFFPSEMEKFCVVTRKGVAIYNLLEGVLLKKLKAPKTAQLMCVDIHSAPENRNLILGTQSHQVLWYDLDFGDLPYKTLKSHSSAVRCVAFHSKPTAYPLFATASDDGQVFVYHSTVFDDYTKNALIVPLKILKGHKITKYIGVLSCQFHSNLPWLFTSGGDGKVYCWVE